MYYYNVAVMCEITVVKYIILTVLWKEKTKKVESMQVGGNRQISCRSVQILGSDINIDTTKELLIKH